MGEFLVLAKLTTKNEAAKHAKTKPCRLLCRGLTERLYGGRFRRLLAVHEVPV
jgi:hypothetical protein